jgi:hypothetical protein
MAVEEAVEEAEERGRAHRGHRGDELVEGGGTSLRFRQA